jgi:thiol-disulfide isomerase/thioredoxin
MAIKRLLTTILATAIAFAASNTAYAGGPKQGDPAPDVVGITLDREPVSLKKYLGKTVVISFWATWCPYCLKELPILNGIQVSGKGRVQVIAINTEERDVFRKVAKALKILDVQLAYDPDEEAQKAYGVNGIPHLVVIDREGKIVSTYRGYDESMLPEIVYAINYANGVSQNGVSQ